MDPDGFDFNCDVFHNRFENYISKNIVVIYLQCQTQRAEDEQKVAHKTQQVRGEGLRCCQPIRELLQQTCNRYVG